MLQLPDYVEWLEDNPLGRLQCYLAWRVGEKTFRGFIEGNPEDVKFIAQNTAFLRDLFDLPEFNAPTES